MVLTPNPGISTNDVGILEEERWYKDGVDVNTVSIGDKHW